MGFYRIQYNGIMKLNYPLDINDKNKKMITFIEFNYVF